MVEILLFAVLSAYLFYRLWSVLGTRTGNEKQRNWGITDNSDNIIVMPKRSATIKEEQNEQESLENKFAKEEELLKQKFKDFSLQKFEKTSKNVFKFVVNAFAESSIEKLSDLVDEKIYKGFEQAIKNRKKEKQTLDIKIKNVESEATEIFVLDDRAKINIRFTSDQLIVTKNSDGEIVENIEGLTNRMIDIWTFSKEFGSKDNAWLLIKTESIN